MLLFETRQACKGLIHTPGYTLTAIGMLGIGLGLVLASFAIMQSFILRPPPYTAPDQIMHVELENTVTGDRNNEVSIHTWLDLQSTQDQLTEFTAYYEGTINVGASGSDDSLRAERYDGVFASSRLFDLLGVQPMIGRSFNAGDGRPEAGRVVILSQQLWLHRFNGDDSILGQNLQINGAPAQIIGVMPEGFRFPRNQGIWVNLDTDVSELERGTGSSLDVLGRLKTGASRQSVENELQQMLDSINQQFPQLADNNDIVVKPLAEEYVNEITRGILRSVMLAVVMVLLIACANVAGLLGARSANRQREQSIRGALGASRKRLLLTGLIEAAVIAGAASLVGLLVAHAYAGWFKRVILSSEDGPPVWVADIHFDLTTFLFAIAVAFVAALVSGWLPAWRASGLAAGGTLRSGGQGSIGSGLGRVGRYLVAFEIALSLMLLVGAGLIIRTVMNIQYIDVGANVSQVISGRVGLFETAYPEPTDVHQFLRQTQQQMRAIPGAAEATLSTSMPMTFGGGNLVASEALAEQDADRLPTANEVIIADNYIDFFDIPLLAGRTFDSREQADSEPVVIISEGLAERLWQSDNPSATNLNAIINQRLRVRNTEREWEYRRVVGVVGEVFNDAEDLTFGSGSPVSGSYYLPMLQSPARFWSVAVRSNTPDAYALSDPLRAAIQSVDSDLPVYWLRTIDDWIDNALYDHRLIAKVFAGFGLVALILTATGLYALLAFSVVNKTREIGVRRALGASAIRIVRTVSQTGLSQLLLGSLVGVVLAYLFARLLGNILYQVSPFDPVTFASVLLVFTLVTILASIIPAMRASRIQPMEALRYE